MNVINLAEWRTYSGSKVFSGRERGKVVRERLRIDDLDHAAEPVEVRIPMDTFSVNQSFFLGMFAKSVRALGANMFRAHYRFDGPPEALRSIQEGIDVCLHQGTALDPFL